MSKRDLKKELKALYQPSSKAVSEVDVPTMRFLMIDGEGDPNTSPAYADAIEALFTVSYAVKFIVKKGPLAIDYGVMPLEGLWWADDMAAFSLGDKSRWKWTMMILQPDFVTPDLIDQAMASARKKLGADVLARLRYAPYTEGRCAQTLHIGPFTSEGPTIERVHQFIAARGTLAGKHHEIYLSDIRKAEPSRWKTIVRQPMAPHL
jgi:hypothetical protein